MIAASSDAGATMLELLIGLGLFAGLLVVAVSVIGPASPAKDERQAVARFIAAARSDAILSGEPGVLVAHPDGVSFHGRRITLAVAPKPARLVIYPDGTLGGDPSAFAQAVGLVRVAGTFRGMTDD